MDVTADDRLRNVVHACSVHLKTISESKDKGVVDYAKQNLRDQLPSLEMYMQACQQLQWSDESRKEECLAPARDILKRCEAVLQKEQKQKT